MVEALLQTDTGKDSIVTIPWIIIAGGFHSLGGMDKANAALAEYLIKRGTPVYLVAHSVDEKFSQQPNVKIEIVPRPAGSFLFGEWHLNQRGQQLARLLTNSQTGARVVVNGGNCNWADINWVHCVHHAWPCVDERAPRWFQIKNRLTKGLARFRETQALKKARLIIANSEKTRRDLIEFCQLDAGRIHTVYLGTDPGWQPATDQQRAAARRWLQRDPNRLLAVFVGALGYDQNKGFDILWQAWQRLCKQADWDVDLLVAGGGGGVQYWQQFTREAALTERIQFLGFTDRVRELLAASDLLISPVRYEAYGLNVQEAICAGLAVIVSGRAGIVERFPVELNEMILTNPEDVDELVKRLVNWRAQVEQWRQRFNSFSALLRSNHWEHMASRIVSICEQ